MGLGVSDIDRDLEFGIWIGSWGLRLRYGFRFWISQCRFGGSGVLQCRV